MQAVVVITAVNMIASFADCCVCCTPLLQHVCISRDATLVCPCQGTDVPDAAYAHIAAFVRTAPRMQNHALWSAVGAALEAELVKQSPRPVWVSTSGLGVAWLHVRLDSAPKYYTDAALKAWPVPVTD